MTAKHDELAEMAAARANIYGLLARVFRAEPTAEFLSGLMGAEFSAVLKDLGVSPQDLFGDKPPIQLAEDLAFEFTRLFIGPGPRLSPHQSLHVETGSGGNEFWSEETVRVKRFMAAAGLELDKDFHGLPDHLAAELEFMQKLAEREAAEWRAGNGSTAHNIQVIQQRFYDEHLNRWVPAFCDKIGDVSEQPYFREMARLTSDFLSFDQAALHQDQSASAA